MQTQIIKKTFRFAEEEMEALNRAFASAPAHTENKKLIHIIHYYLFLLKNHEVTKLEKEEWQERAQAAEKIIQDLGKAFSILLYLTPGVVPGEKK